MAERWGGFHGSIWRPNSTPPRLRWYGMMTKDERRAYERARYARMKATELPRIKANSDRYRAQNQAYIRNLKDTTPCADCNNFYPFYVMDFDHQTEKSFNIAEYSRYGASFQSLLTEIAKCELVCANCHRERTWGHLDGAGK